MPKKIGSFYDSRNALWVDCAECERGGNGTDEDKCSAGWRHKRIGKGGCFCGTLVKWVEVKKNA